MKILANIGKDKVVVEMTSVEVANLTGKYSESDLSSRSAYGYRSGLEPGTEYDVHAMYRRIKNQEAAAKELETAAKSLEALAQMVRFVEPAVKLIGKPDGEVVE